MDDAETAQPASSSENDSEFAALLEAELEKEDGWGSEGGDDAGQEDLENYDDVGRENTDGPEEQGGSRQELTNLVEQETPSTSGSDMCPPHPGYMWNICIRCGKAKEADDEEKGVALRYLHQGLELSESEAARLRKDDLQKLLAQKKLYLVVDLDHTLLNSTRKVEVPESDTAYLRSAYSPITAYPASSVLATDKDDLLYDLPLLDMWTKLRPFVREFLEAASGMFEMYVYTMGEKLYAQAMARLLDPTGRLFGERVISQQDSTSRKTKDLDVVLGAESAVLIIDDSESVWPKNRSNLLVIERYHFFRSSRRQFGLPGESLVEAKKDESSEEGALRGILETLRKVHADFFANVLQEADVRQSLEAVRRRILSGCHVVFSRIFPQDFPHFDSHPLWVLATKLGADCSLALTPETTHVVTVEPGTDKARLARRNGKHVVRPEWLECCHLLWMRAKEEDFPVLQGGKSRQAVPEYARTVERKEVATESLEKGPQKEIIVSVGQPDIKADNALKREAAVDASPDQSTKASPNGFAYEGRDPCEMKDDRAINWTTARDKSYNTGGTYPAGKNLSQSSRGSTVQPSKRQKQEGDSFTHSSF